VQIASGYLAIAIIAENLYETTLIALFFSTRWLGGPAVQTFAGFAKHRSLFYPEHYYSVEICARFAQRTEAG
jgi:hypothetical protein